MPKLWVPGTTPSHKVACELLRKGGFQLTETPSQDVQGVFLDIPSFRSSGFTPTELISLLPNEAAVIGGGLSSLIGLGHPLLDLLEDADFTAQNADITARCAIRLASDQLDVTFRRLPVLILGWGRIGKILAKLLQALDSKVWVYARKEADRAMLQALGYHTFDTLPENTDLGRFRVIFNTVPAPMLSTAKTDRLPGCLLLDLASVSGLAGNKVVPARGLPGLLAPESAGVLIGKTVIRLWEEKRL